MAGPKLRDTHCPVLKNFSKWLPGTLAGLILLTFLVLWTGLIPRTAAYIRERAEAAERVGNWDTALTLWRVLNLTRAARSTTYLGEARACLALNRAAQAERSLRSAISADPTDPEAWRLLLEILRIEDRTLEAQQLGWEGWIRVRAEGRLELLRELTLTLLTELPDELVRKTLQRWTDADPNDIDAQVALLQRITAQPRAADPDRTAVLASLELILASHPNHVGAREALLTALADGGEPDRGRKVLEGWPETAHDARYWRLCGRWELEYERRPERAINPLQTALVAFPQDWRSWYRLARAQQILGRIEESYQAARMVNRIRELLDPLTLGPRLQSALSQTDEPGVRNELAALCRRAGLRRLANAWHSEIHLPVQLTPSRTP